MFQVTQNCMPTRVLQQQLAQAGMTTLHPSTVNFVNDILFLLQYIVLYVVLPLITNLFYLLFSCYHCEAELIQSVLLRALIKVT